MGQPGGISSCTSSHCQVCNDTGPRVICDFQVARESGSRLPSAPVSADVHGQHPGDHCPMPADDGAGPERCLREALGGKPSRDPECLTTRVHDSLGTQQLGGPTWLAPQASGESGSRLLGASRSPTGSQQQLGQPLPLPLMPPPTTPATVAAGAASCRAVREGKLVVLCRPQFNPPKKHARIRPVFPVTPRTTRGFWATYDWLTARSVLGRVGAPSPLTSRGLGSTTGVERLFHRKMFHVLAPPKFTPKFAKVDPKTGGS